MASIDSTKVASTPLVNPAIAASAAPNGKAAPPVVTPAAAAASPATCLLCNLPRSILPLSQAASLIDWLDVMLQAHPWSAPLLYIGIAFGLQRYNERTALSAYDDTVLVRWTPHQLQMTALTVFAGALFAFKTVHTRGLQWIPTALQFLVGGDAAGLSFITPFISRFYYTLTISFPLIAWATLAIYPNQPPVQGAIIASAVMLAPLLWALGKNLAGKTTATVPAKNSVG